MIIAIPVAPLRPETASSARAAAGGRGDRPDRLGGDHRADTLPPIFYLRRFRLDVDDNLLARKHNTQVRVLSRTIDVLLIMLTLGAALMTFPAVRQYGVSLFASAGVAGIVAGLAARPVLSNLMAGVQLAMTQPIRLYDAVIVENEYGTIEEITSTYVVVKLWDLRRMIVPLTYFIEKPFQNWTREDSALIGNVMLYVDYRAPVGLIREKFNEILKQSNKWDGRVASLAGHRLQGRHHGAALPDERPLRRPDLRLALRGAREAHRFSAKGASRGAAALAADQLQGAMASSEDAPGLRAGPQARHPAVALSGSRAWVWLLRFRAACGYPAQEFISAGPESLKIWLASAEIRNDSAGIKGGLLVGPPFCLAYARFAAARIEP